MIPMNKNPDGLIQVNLQAKQLVCYLSGYNYPLNIFKHETAGLVDENCNADPAAEILRSFALLMSPTSEINHPKTTSENVQLVCKLMIAK
jgi:hypothetical protein